MIGVFKTQRIIILCGIILSTFNITAVLTDDAQNSDCSAITMEELNPKILLIDIKLDGMQIRSPLNDIRQETEHILERHKNLEEIKELLSKSTDQEENSYCTCECADEQVPVRILNADKYDSEDLPDLPGDPAEESAESLDKEKQDREYKEDIYPDDEFVISEGSNCSSLLEEFEESGVYEIKLSPDAKPIRVYCLLPLDCGPGWTVIQRRIDGALDFDREWVDYREGFGSRNREYFIGLDNLNQITSSAPHELWVQLEDFDGLKGHTCYDTFKIDNEDQYFRLEELGAFTDYIAWDSMMSLVEKRFVTKDVGDVHKCAEKHSGGWWFSGQENCIRSNLNGRYLNETDYRRENGGGIIWDMWPVDNPDKFSFKYVHMAIRPVLGSE